MAKFTSETAKLWSVKAAAARKLRKAHREAAPKPVFTDPSQPLLAVMESSYAAVTRINSMILKRTSPAALDLLTRSLERVWGIYCEIAGVPERARRRPPSERNGNGTSIPMEATPEPMAPTAPEVPTGPSTDRPSATGPSVIDPTPGTRPDAGRPDPPQAPTTGPVPPDHEAPPSLA